jgi:hypothetical protein
LLRPSPRIRTAAALVTAMLALASSDGRAASETIRGTVLEYRSMRPSIGRLVIVGGKQTTTDVNGRFAIAGPSGAYDLTVVDPERYSVTFYRGLRRRDLVLIHAGDINLSPKGQERHAAHVDGKLSGGGFDPVSSNTAMIHFLSPQTSQDRTLGGQNYDPRGGAFGPLQLIWVGPESITGSLLAVRTIRGKHLGVVAGSNKREPDVWWEAHKEIKVSSGEVTMADLAFKPLVMGRISGRIDVDPGVQVLGRGIQYRFTNGGAIGLDGDGLPTGGATLFDFGVPDVRHLPGQYCADAYDGTNGIFSSTITCGVAFGATNVAMKLRAPPKLIGLKKDRDKETISRDTQFAWTAFEGGIHKFAIECSGGPNNPNVFLYTTATSTPWPDVSAVGMGFPQVGETCTVSVTGIGPYQGMDAAFSPDGIAMHLPKEAYSSRSLQPFVTIARPGKPAAAKPSGQVIDGDSPRRR